MRVSENPYSRIFYAVELKWIVPLYCFDLNFFFFFFLFFLFCNEIQFDFIVQKMDEISQFSFF